MTFYQPILFKKRRNPRGAAWPHLGHGFLLFIFFFTNMAAHNRSSNDDEDDPLHFRENLRSIRGRPELGLGPANFSGGETTVISVISDSIPRYSIFKKHPLITRGRKRPKTYTKKKQMRQDEDEVYQI